MTSNLDRHEIRTRAFQALFALQVQPDQNKMSLKDMLFEDHAVDEYYDVLVNGISNMFSDLDARYDNLLKDGWSASRISLVGKSIIRLAIYEIDERIDIPTKVAIDEAVHLIDDYGDENEKVFVNGLLGQYVKNNG
ncbi:MAG: transcription antitermination factor NusB [Lactobacillaceae bacterium]|jgi:N utilization substance protein B|nr:transcription antitermination factor NusB [Lactobacillaceae bacterium]